MRAIFLCPNLEGGGAERHWSILLPGLRSLGVQVSLATLDGRGEFFSMLEREGFRPGASPTAEGVPPVRAALTAGGRRRCDRQPRDQCRRAGDAGNQGHRHPVDQQLAPARRTPAGAAADAAAARNPAAGRRCHRGERQPGPGAARLQRARAQFDVIHNGTDFADGRADRAAKREELGLADGEVAVLLAGRLEPQKRIDLFIDSLALAQREHPSIVGLVAGSGPLEAELRSQAQGAEVRCASLAGARTCLRSSPHPTSWL